MKTKTMKTARTLNRVVFGFDTSKEEKIALLEAAIAELKTLDANEIWDCRQVDYYFGFKDSRQTTVGEIISRFEKRIKNLLPPN